MRKWLLRRIELDALLALEQTAVIQCPFSRNYVLLTLGPKQIYTVQGHCVTLCKLSCFGMFVMFGSLLAFFKLPRVELSVELSVKLSVELSVAHTLYQISMQILVIQDFALSPLLATFIEPTLQHPVSMHISYVYSIFISVCQTYI